MKTFLFFVLCILSTFCVNSEAVRVTIYEHPDYEGRSKSLEVTRCTNILDFEDEASAIRTSGCVVLYEDRCCQSRQYVAHEDIYNLHGYHDVASSISPCGDYLAPFPKSLRETWLGHDKTMKKVAEVGDIAIYYNDRVKAKSVSHHAEYINFVWNYVKENYGQNFGPEGSRLYAFFHAGEYGGGSINSYFDTTSDCRNLIDVSHTWEDAWSQPFHGWEMDATTHEIAHIVEGNSNGIAGSPSYSFWMDSKWAEIFIYDVYGAWNKHGGKNSRNVQRHWYNEMIKNKDDFPKPNTYWFRDWFLPIYSAHGGVKVLNNYFELLASHWPRRENGWEFVDRDINLGEFVHFYSGAAGVDLRDQAKIAFQWNADDERQFQQARREFPGIAYSE